MSEAAKAARYMRALYQTHDSSDILGCIRASVELYRVLTDAPYRNRYLAARLVREAIWISDAAEVAQKNENVQEEDELYGVCGNLLAISRDMVGLEARSVPFTIAWWKAYRHRNVDDILSNLVEEQKFQLGRRGTLRRAQDCAELIYKAAMQHKEREWDKVDRTLEEYFSIFLPKS